MLTHQYQENLRKNIWLSGPDATFFAEYKACKLQELLPNLVDKKIKILDFGCGDGLVSSFVKTIFADAQIYGVDTSPEHIEVAKLAYENINFAVSDTNIPASDNSFDLVFAAETFHHIELDKHEHYLQEIKRVLKSSGIFVLLELDPLFPVRPEFIEGAKLCDEQLLSSDYSKKLIEKYLSVVHVNFYDAQFISGAIYVILATK